jgi:hypothetical protein
MSLAKNPDEKTIAQLLMEKPQTIALGGIIGNTTAEILNEFGPSVDEKTFLDAMGMVTKFAVDTCVAIGHDKQECIARLIELVSSATTHDAKAWQEFVDDCTKAKAARQAHIN